MREIEKPKFKIGDRVRCIDKDASPLVSGEVYSVRGFTPHGGLKLEEFPHPNSFFYAYRFEPTEATGQAEQAKAVIRGIDPAADAPPEFKAACAVFNAKNQPDPYEAHRAKLISKLKFHERYDSSRPLDQCVALSMDQEDNAPNLWKGEKTTPRERLVAALAKELNRPAPVRFPHIGRNFCLTKRDHE
jgi:hypothetical protein